MREARYRVQRRKRKKDQSQGIGNYERIKITVPKNFDLYNNRELALHFFEKLRETILVQKRMGLIDFRDCESISAGAGLVLAAETERCRTLRTRDGKPTLSGNYPSDPGFRRFLDELGFFRLLKLSSPDYSKDEAIVTRFIAMRSGKRDRGKDMHEIAKIADSDFIRLDKRAITALNEALLEAMNNVTVHAYPLSSEEEKIPIIRGKWWAAGHWDRNKREIGVLIYDQGVGIPATLPDSQHKKLLGSIMYKLGLNRSDQDYIRAAMEIGHTRMRGTHRGRGMASLRHAVTRAAEGHLLIFSGAGGYYYGADGREQVFPLPRSIGGTFIEWRIRDDNLVTWGDE